MHNDLAIALLACFGPVAAYTQSGSPAVEWPYYGGDAGGSRFSSLSQINTSNVQKLKVAWVYHTGDISDGYAALARIYLAVGLPLLFLPVTTASYDGVPPDKTNQASALINVARNLGGSMGVALSQTLLAQRQQFHQSRWIEHIAPAAISRLLTR